MRKNYSLLDDADLIDCIRLDEDHLAFAEVYRRHAKSLYHLSYGKMGTKEMAEEMVQITFIKLWSARKELRINYSLKAYLYKAAKNNIISFYVKHLPSSLSLHDCSEEMLPHGDYTKEQIILSLRQLVTKFPTLKYSPYHSSITNLIAIECENKCAIHLSSDDLNDVWKE